MPKPFEIGDIVDWAPGNPGSDFEFETGQGPFVVVKLYDGLAELAYLSTGLPLKPVDEKHHQFGYGFFDSRFQKNEFLTQARKAVTNAQSR